MPQPRRIFRSVGLSVHLQWNKRSIAPLSNDFFFAIFGYSRMGKLREPSKQRQEEHRQHHIYVKRGKTFVLFLISENLIRNMCFLSAATASKYGSSHLCVSNLTLFIVYSYGSCGAHGVCVIFVRFCVTYEFYGSYFCLAKVWSMFCVWVGSFDEYTRLTYWNFRLFFMVFPYVHTCWVWNGWEGKD